MPQITISNANGTLNCDAIAWSERQTCKVAIRDIPLRQEGSYVDEGTYVLKNRRISMTIRLTDAQKTTLQHIFCSGLVVTITASVGTTEFPRWEYTAWLRKKPVTYQYSKEDSSNIREWITELEFVVSIFNYYTEEIEFDEPLDWAYFKDEGEIWFNEEAGGYAGYPIYITDPFAEQGGGYFERV